MKFARTSFAVKATSGHLKSTAHFSALAGIFLSVLVFATPRSQAQFSPGPNPISGSVTAAQTIAAGSGTVSANSSLTVSNASTATDAITVTGNSSIVNSGTIQQTTAGSKAGRAIRLNAANVTVIITNNVGGLITAADSDPIQINKASDSVVMFNFGTVDSPNPSAGGAQAIDWSAITTGSNILYNYSSGTLTASEADAVRPGVNGVVYNYGLIKSITSTASSSDGIDAQANTGIVINNGSANIAGALIEGGRHGITGGSTPTGVFTMGITNQNNSIIQGDNGSGINIDGTTNNAGELVSIVNSGTITGRGVTADGDGVDVDGLVNITNNGVIKSLNSFNDTSEGITVGGGTIINTGTIEGDIISGSGGTGTGRGITFAGVDKDSNDNPIPAQGIYGVVNVTNSGLIKGQSNSGITVTGSTSGFAVTITNLAGGNIEGDGATMAAFQGSNDNTTITNSGTIMAANSGTAIIFGSGSNVLNVTGGQASILGNIVGGSGTDSMVINPGAGNSFNYSGAISSFSSVAVNSGTVTFTGASTYSGSTTITGGKLIVNGSIANSAVRVNSGGVLAGSGTSGFITVSAGAKLAPGDPTSFTATGLAINGGATANGGGVYHVDITAGVGVPVAGSTYDQTVLTASGVALSLDKTDSTGSILSLSVAGTLRESGIGSPGNPYDAASGNVSLDNYFILKLQAGSASLDPTNNRFALASDGTNFVAINYNPLEFSGNNPDGIGTFTLDGQEWAISYNGDYDTNSTIGGNDVVITAIPEPRTYALVIGGFGLLFLFRRRRRRGLFAPAK